MPIDKNVDFLPNNSGSVKTDVKSDEMKKVPFAVVEAYKSIRANLMFQLGKEEGRVVVFSSPNAGEGKTTTAVNIAIAFAQLGDKVLLIDADMRRPSAHKKLRLENTKGLSGVIAKLDTFSESVVKVNNFLDVLTAGKTPPNPSELLGSSKFDDFLEEIKPNYSMVIIDTPPIGIVSDALLIAPRTDGLLLIVRDGFTPRDTISHALSSVELANVKVLGAVMNGANPSNSKKYSYRKYYYGSGKYGSGKYGYNKYGYGKYGYGKYGSYGYGYGYGSSAYGYNAASYGIVETDDKKERKKKKKDK